MFHGIEKKRIRNNIIVFAVLALAAGVFFGGVPAHRLINAMFLGGIPLLLWGGVTVLYKMDMFHIWVKIGRYIRRQSAKVKSRADEEPPEEDTAPEERKVAKESILVGGMSVLAAVILSLFYI